MISDRSLKDDRQQARASADERIRRPVAVTSGPVLLPPRRPSAWARELLAELQATDA